MHSDRTSCALGLPAATEGEFIPCVEFQNVLGCWRSAQINRHDAGRDIKQNITSPLSIVPALNS